jgi:ADP-ribose pyrophosphatase
MKPEKQTTHFHGRIIRVTTDEVVLPNGYRAELEVVHHPGGAAVVAIDEAEGWIWELPAGKLEPNEPPLITAQRELVEEAGVSAEHWHTLDSYLSSPGIFTEVLHLYLATGLKAVASAHEKAEVIEVHWMPFTEACEWALSGKIRDGKTALGLLRARYFRSQHPT